MARKDNLSKLIREEWPAKLDAELKRRYGTVTETKWNIATKSFETTGVALTAEMIAYIHGYMMAMNHVYIWNGRV